MAKKDKEKSAREPYYLTIVSDTGCARKHSAGGSADAPAERMTGHEKEFKA